MNLALCRVAVVLASLLSFPACQAHESSAIRRHCSAFYVRLDGAGYSAFLLGCKEDLDNLSPRDLQPIGQILEPALENGLETHLMDRLNISLQGLGKSISAIYVDLGPKGQHFESDGNFSYLTIKSSSVSAVLFGGKREIASLSGREVDAITQRTARIVQEEGYSLLTKAESPVFRKSAVRLLNSLLDRDTFGDLYLASYVLSEPL